MTALSRDSIGLRGAGVVTVTQPVNGHRFTLDSILLADFCRVRPGERVLEPGAGAGVISLLLAKKQPQAHYVAVEVQQHLASLCEQNILDNCLTSRIEVLPKDLRRLGRKIAPGSMSVIVANPPYRTTGTGRQSPDRSRATARQAPETSLASWLDLHRCLKNRGRYSIVFPADRLAELVLALRKRTLEPKRLRMVHAYADRPAAFVLLEAVKQAGAGLEVLPPLVVHERAGSYSREMCDIYAMTRR